MRCAQRSVGCNPKARHYIGPGTRVVDQLASRPLPECRRSCILQRVHTDPKPLRNVRAVYIFLSMSRAPCNSPAAPLQPVYENFIFLSSIAVNGSTTDGRRPFCEQDSIAPDTVYGESKAIAERRLSDLAANSKMSITAIRAPMIYGDGAVGNFDRLRSAVRAGVPLPFGFIRNRRAFLGIDNLTSFVKHRLGTSNPSSFEVFLLADNEQVSTPEFIRLLARACARPTSLARSSFIATNTNELFGTR